MPLLKASRHGQPPPLSNLVLGPDAEASFEGECISNDPSLVVLGIGYGVHTKVGRVQQHLHHVQHLQMHVMVSVGCVTWLSGLQLPVWTVHACGLAHSGCSPATGCAPTSRLCSAADQLQGDRVASILR